MQGPRKQKLRYNRLMMQQWSNLTEGAWNYIRFNLVSARYWRIYGNSGNAVDMQIDEIKVLDAVSDANVRNLHGHIPISTTDTSLNNAGV